MLSLCLLLAAFLPAQTATRATRQSHPPTATGHPFLWRINGKGDQTFDVESWLYGTMHSGDERLVTLPDAVEHARKSADALYFEVDMSPSRQRTQTSARMMFLPPGQTLADRLPSKLYRRLSRYATDHGIQMRIVDRLQVWAVSLHVDQMNAKREKMTENLDRMLYQEAKEAGKEVGGLEMKHEQLGARSRLPERDSIEILSHSLDYLEKLDAKGVGPTRMLLEAYLAGDEAKIMGMVHEAFGNDKELVERFMNPTVERNVRIAGRMTKMMAAHPQKSYFFAVGALHCLGKDGVVELLRRKGYTIQRIGAPRSKTKRRRRWL